MKTPAPTKNTSPYRGLAVLIFSMALLCGCGPSINSANPDDRVAAIKKAEKIDQPTLIRIATSDPFPEVRKAAAERVDDQQTLIRIASSKPEGFEAAEQKALQNYLEYMVNTGQANPDAAKALKEGKTVFVSPMSRMLVDMAIESAISDLGCTAVERITDVEALKRIVEAKNFWSKRVQEVAGKRLATLEVGKQ